jgi:hypothetical protein
MGEVVEWPKCRVVLWGGYRSLLDWTKVELEQPICATTEPLAANWDEEEWWSGNLTFQNETSKIV